MTKIINNKHKTIEERIKQLEQQKVQLVQERSKEISNIIIKYGGIGLDDRLLAGFAIFATNEVNKNSDFLVQILELGKELKIPRSKMANK